MRSQVACALGACGGLARILILSAVNAASKEPVNLACGIPDQELDRSRQLAQVHQEVTRCLGRPHAVGVRGDAGQVRPAGAVLNDDQGVEAPEGHGVNVDEVD
jgi:hypothetical protein